MAQLHSRYYNGNLLYWEGHRKRIVDAIGKDVFKYELIPSELNATAVDPSGWTTTVVEVGTGTTEFDVNNTAGRTGTITTAANEDDGGSYQLLGENFQCSSTNNFYLGAELQVSDATQSDLFFGVAVTDTALLGGVADAAYFESVDASTGISTVTEKGSTETQNDSAGTLADATDIILEMYWNGTNMEFLIDGVSVSTHTANIPDDEAMRVSIEFLAGEAVAKTCNFKWLRAIQIGR